MYEYVLAATNFAMYVSQIFTTQFCLHDIIKASEAFKDSSDEAIITLIKINSEEVVLSGLRLTLLMSLQTVFAT